MDYTGEGKDLENPSSEVHIVGTRGALMDLPTNDIREPILPQENDWPRDLASHAKISWLKKLVRSFLGFHYFQSRDIISDSGEEFDFQAVEDADLSDDDLTAKKKEDLSHGTSEGKAPLWTNTPEGLPTPDINLWNDFIKNLPDSCSEWSHEQAMKQFQVFKIWSTNYHSSRQVDHQQPLSL
ncbi:uncharacterized protein LACBIDRAFT_334543 [Laccaria bicolor S238N-H82]|uniref:Predicted protein n=1 Tax=Laccaria bicolor (strain S238N-H82 / ATCC MYA-4686) TaxID=486041 RepID=B0DZH4_LACBS|nr:uncharacterized protein LACBIDRAFT_334543 [Laccaria bicolor S238N-H82]EDR00020.1 predicted protein [Laccaria bicolor S238N-H82]|eukprot:XP_001889329.1 predicted protein [Laccaria bicolor S238N-H82]